MLHSSTKQLLLGGLGAWRCLATDWELCGYAENKERGNISCIKMQYPGLDDLSLAQGHIPPFPHSRMAALKDPLARRLQPEPPVQVQPTLSLPLIPATSFPKSPPDLPKMSGGQNRRYEAEGLGRGLPL